MDTSYDAVRTGWIWDLLVRSYHWILAIGFLVAFAIARLAGEHSPLFPFHMILGLTLAVAVGLRLVWGLVGTRWARFSALSLSPRDFGRYAKSLLGGAEAGYVGHNPATSAVLLLTAAGVLALAVTGWSLTRGGEAAEDLHPLLATLIFALAVAHMVGVVVHAWRHRDHLTWGMVSGKKRAPEEAFLGGSGWLAGLVFLGLVGAFAVSLVMSFDRNTQTARIPLLGIPVRLGEGEGEEGEYREGRARPGHREEREDDDD